MASAPRGLLKVIALQLLSESSLSGAELQDQIRRTSGGAWKPGPGSIYFMIRGLRDAGMIVELPGGKGTTRRYVISNKGKAELQKKKGEVGREVRKQVELLAYYSDLAGEKSLSATLRQIAGKA